MFKGKTAIVTGASGGIGRNICFALGKEKCNVMVNYLNNEEQASKIAEEIKKLGGNAISFRADVRKKTEVKNMAEKTISEFGRIDFLINNAGITKDVLFVNMTEEEWDEVIDVNLKGTFNCTKAILPLMLEQGFGRVINMASVSGQTGNIGQANYSASKSAIIGFTRSLAREVADKGINVNAVAPGLIATEMNKTIPEKVMQKFLAALPAKRIGTPEEVVGPVIFLLSDKSAYITGQVISVNGGLFIG
ncbi:MAG: 3-oxoacyl-[acyl-carrier-protein] reductase [archaeon]|nr:3-oxoacyl-[acyl-carrier-protein] reductase [archaeon]